LELVIANNELAFQNDEKEKRAAELIIANKELTYQNTEKENRASELIIANRELAFQNQQKQKRADELIIANNELAFQNNEKEKRATELNVAIWELKKAEQYLKSYISGLKEITFITSHKVRQPIANILGLASIIDLSANSAKDLKHIIDYIKGSAIDLDSYVKELTAFITDLEHRGQYKDENSNHQI
jgi:signal transduction histidine kinase